MKSLLSILILLLSTAIFGEDPYLKCEYVSNSQYDECLENVKNELENPRPAVYGPKLYLECDNVPDAEFGECVDEAQKADLESRAKVNTQKDIIYGVGAAGITMDTVFKRAKNILSIPSMEEDGPEVHTALYDEGIYVVWASEAPKVPELIVLTKGYKGVLKTGIKKIGDLRVGSNLNKFFTDEDPNGEYLLRNIYNRFEGEDSSFDCYKEGICTTKKFAGIDKILLISPKMILLVDRAPSEVIGRKRSRLLDIRLIND